MGLIKKITLAAKNQKTYRVGLLQTKVYRMLKQSTTAALSPYGISSVHWAFLGMLYDQENPIRPADIARELLVEAPFVTQMVNELKDKEFILTVPDTTDTRAKLLSLTPKGKKFVVETENYLRKEMRPIVNDISISDLLSYITVLEKMIQNHTLKK